MASTKSITFDTLPEYTLEEVNKKVYNKTLGILIGKGMSFNNEELEKIGNKMGRNVTETDIMRSIHKWLYDKKQELGIEIGTYGADYIKIKDDGSIVGSAMYEMAYHFDCEMIAVSHPDNFGSENKYIGNNSKGLLRTDGQGWGGYKNDPSNPTGATKTTIEFMTHAKKIYLLVVSGGKTTAQELEVYKKMDNVEIIMLNLGLDSPGEIMANNLEIKMEDLILY
tara:strand:- start:216 stop:887 length:672 start_codon:yes stop_codon:yes gene_type:complete